MLGDVGPHALGIFRLLGVEPGRLDALDAEGALLHHALAADGDVRVQHQVHRLRPVVDGVVEPVEAADLVGAVVGAVPRADAAVVDHPVQAFLVVVGREHGTHGLAGRRAAVLAHHRRVPHVELAQLFVVDARRPPDAKLLIALALDDDSDQAPLMYHEEPIYRDGELIGSITSGMYGHRLDASIGMGYLENPEGISDEWILQTNYEIEVEGQRVPAKVHLKPVYDPEGRRVKM